MTFIGHRGKNVDNSSHKYTSVSLVTWNKHIYNFRSTNFIVITVTLKFSLFIHVINNNKQKLISMTMIIISSKSHATPLIFYRISEMAI